MSCNGNYTLNIRQGEDYLLTATRKTGAGVPVDLTGATFIGQIRSMAGSPVDIQDLTVTLFDAPNGVFLVILTAAQTALLPVAPNVGYQNVPTLWTYDVIMTLAGKKIRVLMGSVSVSPEVSL